jgi:hypothetical protein
MDFTLNLPESFSPDFEKVAARLERKAAMNAAVVNAADALIPDWREHPWLAAEELARRAKLFAVGYNRVQCGSRSPTDAEKPLTAIMGKKYGYSAMKYYLELKPHI